MEDIPKSHPRYESLMTRKKISDAMKKGLVHETGLIAHGRGEAFDYLIGEKTIPAADEAEKIAAASLIIAKNPIISVNGNVVVLTGMECINLSEEIPAKIEVNLFHRTDKRMKLLTSELLNLGASKVYGLKGDARIPGLDHDRGICDSDGIFSSDVVLVPLEDGDRCQALKNMNKTVIAIDLNPLSRTAKTANITIVDNVTRAIPNIEKWVKILKNEDKNSLEDLISRWDNRKMILEVCAFISKKLNLLF
ncbi:MAG: phosphopantothenate/pantothenate synthetase [Candidatus Thermoplasmatota archaeon]|nr:phosphopantothenate/pantothenate synthetase [Candidatus Thermoplasmatota archaeon]